MNLAAQVEQMQASNSPQDAETLSRLRTWLGYALSAFDSSRDPTGQRLAIMTCACWFMKYKGSPGKDAMQQCEMHVKLLRLPADGVERTKLITCPV